MKKFLIFFIGLILFFSSSNFALALCFPGCDLLPCSLPVCSTCGPGLCRTPSQSFSRDLGHFSGLGPLGNPTATEQDPGASAFSDFISKTIGIMTIVGFIWFIFVLFSGAIAWLSSGGDKTKLQNAQKQITTGLIGLVIVISAIFIIKIVGLIFGIDILNIADYIQKLYTK